MFERRELAAATTSRAAALLTRVRTTASQTALMTETRRAIDLVQEELGEPLGVSAVGSMHVAASETSEASLLEFAQLAGACREEIHWIDRADAKERVPWLDTSETRRIGLIPGDAFVDPYLLATFYGRAARARGVEFHTASEVLGLVRDGDRVTGLRTVEGEVSAGCIIDAARTMGGIVGFRSRLAPADGARSQSLLDHRSQPRSLPGTNRTSCCPTREPTHARRSAASSLDFATANP